ncbi:hypothetical protein OIU78_023945 [Salix suchowensis]|nr:hypothetical protein OIU78_023945 [Salix suchowensis]
MALEIAKVEAILRGFCYIALSFDSLFSRFRFSNQVRHLLREGGYLQGFARSPSSGVCGCWSCCLQSASADQ